MIDRRRVWELEFDGQAGIVLSCLLSEVQIFGFHLCSFRYYAYTHVSHTEPEGFCSAQSVAAADTVVGTL